MNVADLEPRAFAGESARAERRQPPFMRDFGQRVGLIHELRELRGAEELLDHGGSGLVVDQLLRHQGLDILQPHALLDRPLHPHQSDAELVFDQFADRAHAAVAEMVDIVDSAVAVLELDQIADDFQDILAAQRALLQRHGELELVVELQPANLGQIVALRIEEQVVKKLVRRSPASADRPGAVSCRFR